MFEIPIIDAAGKIIAESGLAGAFFIFVTIPVAWFAYRTNNKYHIAQKEYAEEISELTANYAKEIQVISEKRTEDAQEVIDRLIKLNNSWNSTINEQIRITEMQREWQKEIKEALKDLGRKK